MILSHSISAPSTWRWERLEGVTEGIFDCPHSTPQLTSTGPLLARSQDVRTGVFRTGQAGHVSEETYRDRIRRAEPRAGDLLYSREGTYFGLAAEVPLGTRVCLGQRMVLIRPDPTKVDSRFLRYWLNSPYLSSHVYGHRDGSVAERLNLPTIRKLPVLLPSLVEQKSLASVLGALDEKIEMNRRMNQTLEAMARAIFKSWFVDFDPVREGHYLFPKHLEVSRLGSAPAGWSVRPIGEVVTVVGGTTPSTSEQRFWNGSYHFATPRDMARLTDPILLETERTVTQEGLSQIGSGLLPQGTVLLSSRAPVGYLAITDIPVAVNQGFIAMICNGELPNFYIFEWAKQNMGTIVGNANGTTFLEISKRNFRPIPVLVPPKPVLDSFVAIVSPMFQKITVNIRESKTLAALRDALLPKLLSGEIRIKQAEKIVGEVA